ASPRTPHGPSQRGDVLEYGSLLPFSLAGGFGHRAGVARDRERIDVAPALAARPGGTIMESKTGHEGLGYSEGRWIGLSGGKCLRWLASEFI
ncbi:MAG TPA: hypothetical protein VGZ22_19780, partial [Isosphaeraceae bacterium]|nr:hypothetical protein [Isosphaeraceae bacterium]